MSGIDLSQPLDSDTVAAIRSAAAQYGAIFFRKQSLTPTQQVTFLSQFGPLQQYDPASPSRIPKAPDVVILSNIYHDDKPICIIEAGHYWHSDMPYGANPPSHAALYAVEVPRDAHGNRLGGTMMVSTGHAYDTLGADMKSRIDGLRAIQSRDKRKFCEVRLSHKNEYDGVGLSQEHPVVRIHSLTGRKCLYVNETYTARIVGLNKDDSDELLIALCRHITREEARYTHRWEVGDLLMWDDCAIQHHAVNDYALPQRRRLHRTVLAGTKPF